MQNDPLIPTERIERVIFVIRGHNVVLDSDLAQLYGVTTSRLNEQIKRNGNRFPEDFMFRLTPKEFKNLISQSATSSSKWGGRRKLPLAFTEHGAVMAANVLSSPVAVAASIQVVRAFVRLRQILATHKDLAHKLEELERKLGQHDEKFRIVFDAIRQLRFRRRNRKRNDGSASRAIDGGKAVSSNRRDKRFNTPTPLQFYPSAVKCLQAAHRLILDLALRFVS
jgi:hypothetical protein